eukprot:TRINITY_DN2985_c0_g1_i1.p1 TRINITY_DN2985_c0_g1~~TRINITY_DN2985_c0_g1_i1.p1  ORF type:complete len:950 (-),score=328.83 TRINITY_DN2985_c0_g1_i1:224-3004(-)
MGAKFSKSSKGEKKWDEMKVNGKSLPANFDKTSTLPASFRRRDEEVVLTGTLPRNLNRNQSFSKRFRKSCKNWAAQKGLIDPCKAEQTETQSQVPTKPSSVVLAQEECTDKITDVAQDLPQVVITRAQSLDMLVESNAIQMEASSNDDSIETGQEAKCEVEALANSAEAEIVIEASSKDIDKSDIITNDSPVNELEVDKKTENKMEETSINSESVIEVKIETETENITQSNIESSEGVVEEEKEVPITEAGQEVIDTATVSSTELQEVVNAKEVNEIMEENMLTEVGTETESVNEENKITEEQNIREEEINENICLEEVSKEAISTESEITEEKISEVVVKETECSIVPEVVLGENDIAEDISEKIETPLVLEQEEGQTIDKETIQTDEVHTEDIITTEEVKQEQNANELDIKAPDTQEIDESEHKIDEIEDSSNIEIISLVECNKETINEDENVPVPIVAEMIEVVENIEVTETASDNIADKEEDSHETEITDDNKSEKAMEEDKNNLNISADECNEQETCLEENCVGQEEIGTEEIAADQKQDDAKTELVVEDIPCTASIVDTSVNIESQPETEESDLVKSEDTQPIAEEMEKVEDISEPTDVISSTDGTWKCQWDIPCLASETEEESQMKNEDTEPNTEEVEKVEDISEQNEVISSSDGTWKYQWDLPCLASNDEEESQMTKQRTDTDEISHAETPEELESQDCEQTGEELNPMNDGLGRANTLIEGTGDMTESVSEIESKEVELDSVTCEPEMEKKTEAVNDELDNPESDANTQEGEGESNVSLPELEEVEIKKEEDPLSDNAEPNSLESLEDEKGDAVTAINNENKHVETDMKDILTDIVDNIASKSENTSLENISDAPADDLISEGGSDGCVSTDEGIAASDDDDKDSCKSEELKKDNAKEIAESEIKIENLITEIDEHP